MAWDERQHETQPSKSVKFDYRDNFSVVDSYEWMIMHSHLAH